MLDISFTELTICLVIALIVLGPEKLPAVARAVGRWTGQARGYLRNLSAELDRETRASDLRKQLEDAKKLLNEQERSTRDAVNKVMTDVKPPPADKP
ncbi:Sec-independent protein translocase protein TatB [Flagellatimonas centrodinii]|uniref:Sec-independent protein translocase protein TatB n=1 Tax=Flagellatimonas centrodinii TaxID=2806210 RepID=UPI001FF05B29|nr:Sec-independent protein translocase protein TatB [Flagellatimonas centrodinii]ULQ47905.1 Sec-independent protein translocase protein TatB [Flagellatimonas centrodinii]